MKEIIQNKLLILDSCVLIDFMNGEPKLFHLLAEKVGKIHVVTPIIEEVDSIQSLKDLEDLGLIALEPDIEDVFTALKLKGKTSFQDQICYLTAKRYQLTCVTNDKPLRKLCEENHIPTFWGLELIIELTKLDGVSKKKALDIAKVIHKSNPIHIHERILSNFEAALNRIQ